MMLSNPPLLLVIWLEAEVKEGRTSVVVLSGQFKRTLSFAFCISTTLHSRKIGIDCHFHLNSDFLSKIAAHMAGCMTLVRSLSALDSNPSTSLQLNLSRRPYLQFTFYYNLM